MNEEQNQELGQGSQNHAGGDEFSQIAEGIGEDTWLFHLRRGDYSHWFRASVKDNYLADQAERVEQRQDLEPAETRRLIRGLIEARYTLPK